MQSPAQPSYERFSRPDADQETGEGGQAFPSRNVARSQSFTARQACENCRAKKTRCDGFYPCSLCRRLGVQCSFTGRKKTKNEATIEKVMTTLLRVEYKINNLRQGEGSTIFSDSEYSPNVSYEPQMRAEPERIQLFYNEHNETRETIPGLTDWSPTERPISFSAHQVLHWPAVQETMPEAVSSCYCDHGPDYATRLEVNREPLLHGNGTNTSPSISNFLADLSFVKIRQLCEAYFSSFNLINPILDRDFFFHNTLGVMLSQGFGTDIETCLALAVMALGSCGTRFRDEVRLGQPSHEEHDESLATHSQGVTESLDKSFIGLHFFNESRSRIGFLNCDNTLQSTQYYLLSALFYAQLVRPFDMWMMVNRASTNCLLFWDHPNRHEKWQADMQSRLYWNALMLESILSEELNLPRSGLDRLKDKTPLPTFVKYHQPNMATSAPEFRQSDDAYYQYHFLAQIAHRIILTRARQTVFYSKTNGDYPRPALVAELRHQLEQWRGNLPPALQFDERCDPPPPPSSIEQALVSAFLVSRYRVARFHMGRPFLYKALHQPALLTDDDLNSCAETLYYAMRWTSLVGTARLMRNCMILKFSICSQVFGILLICYCLRSSSDARLRALLPDDHASRCSEIMVYLEEMSRWSPTVAKDFEIISILYERVPT